MAALEIEGRIVNKLAKTSGQTSRGSWTKQDFIIEYQDGNYPTQVCFTSFGDDKVADLDKYSVGDAVKVAFNIKAREYNGRWYNDVRVWRISPAGADQPARQEAQARSWQQPQVTESQAPTPTLADMPADDSADDLPF